MKVFTMYEGWEEDPTNKRSKLVGKTVLAGMENSKEFHEKREALIEKHIMRMKYSKEYLMEMEEAGSKKRMTRMQSFSWTGTISIRKY